MTLTSLAIIILATVAFQAQAHEIDLCREPHTGQFAASFTPRKTSLVKGVYRREDPAPTAEETVQLTFDPDSNPCGIKFSIDTITDLTFEGCGIGTRPPWINQNHQFFADCFYDVIFLDANINGVVKTLR